MEFSGIAEALERELSAFYMAPYLKGYTNVLKGLLQECPAFELEMKTCRGADVIEEFHEATIGWLISDKWAWNLQDFDSIRVPRNTITDSSGGKGESPSDVIYYRHPDLNT